MLFLRQFSWEINGIASKQIIYENNQDNPPHHNRKRQ